NLYLTGRPTLKEFLRYVRRHAVNSPSEAALAESWQAAHEVVCRLEREEAGIADDPPIGKLGAACIATSSSSCRRQTICASSGPCRSNRVTSRTTLRPAASRAWLGSRSDSAPIS